jgi:hypothetical protein
MSLIVVSGAIANKPHQGGSAWVRLSYLRGLRRLGYRVHFVEQIDSRTCVDAHGAPAPLESSVNRTYFDRVMDEFGLAGCGTLLVTDGEGRADVPPSLIDLADAADALLNISGHLAIAPLVERFRNKVYIDIDPGFTQFWHAAGSSAARLAGHDSHFTIGVNIGQPDCPIPSGGIAWRRTLPPVVLSDWPVVPAAESLSANRPRKGGPRKGEQSPFVPRTPQKGTVPGGLRLGSEPLRFTTIANWRGPYGPVEFGGRTFGLKVHEFRKVFSLPAQVTLAFELALGIHSGDDRDLAALRAGGWKIVDPLAVAATPTAFRRYVQESGAEFSVAQGVYVDTRGGWFSDRTTRYLASGKPVLVQDTGTSRYLPAGEGIVLFRSLEEAIDGAKSIAADYPAHCRAARRIAEQYFDSDKVLGRLMEEIGVSP